MGLEISPELNIQKNSDLVEEYKSLLLEFTELAKANSVYVRPYLNDRELNFNQLKLAQQKSVLEHLRSYVKTCANTVAEGHSLDNSSALTWQMLKEYKFTPQSDIMDKIKSSSVIEFYNSENVQIFRNLNFFRICSYTFDELLCRPWWELYRRDDSVTRQIFEYAVQIFTQTDKKTLKVNIPPHYLEEIASEFKYKMEISLDYLSPLTSGSQVVAGLAIERVRLES